MTKIQKLPKIYNDPISKMTKNDPNSKLAQIQKWTKFKIEPNSKMTQIKKWPQLKNDPNKKMTSIKKLPKFKNDPNSKITQNQKWPKTNNVPNSKMTQNYIKKWCNGHAHRRRAGRRLVRFAFARPSSLFCVPVLFLFLYLLWVYVFYGFYVGPAKLQRGATPPSVMVF